MSAPINERNFAIAVTELYKTYRGGTWGRCDEVRALENVALSIQGGRIVGLVGPNGAGKTTLLTLIAGLLFPTRGRISVCGFPARSIQARRRLGYMPETPVFLGRYSARAVLAYHGALFGLSRREIRRKTRQLLSELELDHAAQRACYKFSRGMKQRLALAVALMNDPQVLLLDEPSNGLDPIGIVKLRSFLSQLRESGKTILVSSHRLGELERLTSDFVFLYRGRVMPFGDRLTAREGGRLKIGLARDGSELATQISSRYPVAQASETEVVFTVAGEKDAPDIVSEIVRAGGRVTRVLMEEERIEDIFLRLYKEVGSK